jgi:peptide/nickel transport system substrate-binding protein
MTLRDDITFQDGTPLTAEDVAFTFELLANPAVGSPLAAYASRMQPGARPEVVDPTHLVWRFTEAYDRDTQMGHMSSVAVLPKHHLHDADLGDLRTHPLASQPLSYGPFKLGDSTSDSFTLVRNDAFSGPNRMSASLEAVKFQVIEEYEARLAAFEAGEVDLVSDILVDDVDRMRAIPGATLHRRGWKSLDFIAWNMKNPLFEEVNVRTALSHAVDIQGLLDTMHTDGSGEVYARPAVGTVTPALCGAYNDTIRPLHHSAATATEMLAAAGWTDTDDDGIIDKDGQPFSFTLHTNSSNKRRTETAERVTEQLAAIGVQMTVELEETNAFFERTRVKDFEAALLGWSADLFADPSSIWHSDTEDRTYEFNMVSYANPRVDELLDEGLRTTDPREAAKIYQEVQALIYADQPYTFLWWTDRVVALKDSVEGEEIDMVAMLHHLHEWSKPQE